MTVRLCRVCPTPLNRKQRTTCSVACRHVLVGIRSRTYTDAQEAEIIRLRTAERLSISLIAKRTGMALGSVGHVLTRLKVPVPEELQQEARPARASSEQAAIMRAMYPAGGTFDDIAPLVNALPGYRMTTPELMSDWAKRLGLQRTAEARTRMARQRAEAYHASRKPAPKVVVAAPAKPKTYAPSRAQGEGAPAPAPGAKPITVSKPALIRIGVYDFGLEPDDALDYARVSAEARKSDPTHPGFRPAATNYGWGESA